MKDQKYNIYQKHKQRKNDLQNIFVKAKAGSRLRLAVAWSRFSTVPTIESVPILKSREIISQGNIYMRTP